MRNLLGFSKFHQVSGHTENTSWLDYMCHEGIVVLVSGCKKVQTFIIPIHSITVLYNKLQLVQY